MSSWCAKGEGPKKFSSVNCTSHLQNLGAARGDGWEENVGRRVDGETGEVKYWPSLFSSQFMPMEIHID
jgi:hypothetical protein